MATNTVRRWPIPTKNDRQLQHSSLEISIRGTVFPHISEVSYDMTLEPGEAYGLSPFTTGLTLGNIKANASITIHRRWRERFLNLVEQGTPGFMDKLFLITVQAQEFGMDVETDKFNARITGSPHESSEGNSVLVVKFPLWVGYVDYNGHTPFEGIGQVL